MKKILSAAIGVIALALCVSAQAAAPKKAPAQAPAPKEDNRSNSYYIGFDLQQHNIDYDNGLDAALDDRLNGANIYVGRRFNKNFGAELGYFRTQEDSKAIGLDISGITGTPGDVINSTEIMAQGVTLDGLGYLPLDSAGRFELIGTAGVSWIKADLTVNGILYGTAVSASDDESEFGYRAGAGAQYGITDRLNLRGLARYQSMDFGSSGFDVANNAWIYSLGANYSF